MSPLAMLILELVEDGVVIIRQQMNGKASDRDMAHELSSWRARIDGELSAYEFSASTAEPTKPVPPRQDDL